MLQAAQYLIGEHNFRNFCKLDRENKTTMRRVLSVEIEENKNTSPYAICHLIINGQSFVWHQIRCIVGVLLLVGQNFEEPEVVKELLDIERYPQYVDRKF
jgi:tRNA pseudouridine38/39 synthase